MAAAYSGSQTDIISALNAVYTASTPSTLNAAYMRLDGTSTMDANDGLKLSEGGLSVKTGTDLKIRTEDSSNAMQDRITVADVTGNVGVGKVPGSYKLDVLGSANATTLRYAGEDTDVRYLRAGGGAGGITAIAVGLDLQGANTISGDLTIGSELVFDADGYTFSEWSQDLVGAMVTGNTETGGISAVYNDSTGKLTLAIANNAHSHTTANITGFDEAVQDLVGGMVAGNSESGISVTYNDSAGKVNFDVNDPTITLTGDVTGSATMTNLGSLSIATTVATAPTLNVYDVNGTRLYP